MDLSRMKPVLKKVWLHNEENVILSFKSMEITVTASSGKSFNPIYVRISALPLIFTIPEDQEHELVRLLFENVEYSEKTKNFEFQHSKLEAMLSKLVQKQDSLITSGIRNSITTSYLQEGVELQIKIAFPRIEYENPNELYSVEKTLS